MAGLRASWFRVPKASTAVQPGPRTGEGIGLHVEDDYWVGPVGLECLSCALPRWPPHMQRREPEDAAQRLK